MRKVLVSLVALAILAAAGYGVFHFVTRPPDFARTGGTILEYEVDADGGDWHAARLQGALEQRLDPDRKWGIQVKTNRERVEIRLPHEPGDSASVDHVKGMLAQVGNLEFRVLANQRDDRDAVEAMIQWFQEIQQLPEAERQARQDELDQRARHGQPPPVPEIKGNRSFAWSTGNGSGRATYSWIELGPLGRKVDDIVAGPQITQASQLAAQGRAKDMPMISPSNLVLFYSRPCVNENLSPEERRRMEFDYFYLTRDSPPEQTISGEGLIAAYRRLDEDKLPVLDLGFDAPTGKLIFELTSANRQDPNGFGRHLAVILDGRVVTKPVIASPIRSDARLAASWSEAQADALGQVLRSGPLPVKLKPVAERAVPPGGSE